MRLNDDCDSRVCKFGIIFIMDIANDMITTKLDFKTHASDLWEGSTGPSKTNFSPGNKNAFFEKGHRPILIKTHFWNPPDVCSRMVYLISFVHDFAFRRTVRRECAKK